MTAVLLHAAVPEDWEQAHARGAYTMSTRGRSLDDVGFVHCAYEHQIEGVVNRFYSDLYELVLLRIDADQLNVPIVLEDLDGAGDLFPHVYGPLPVHAVVDVHRWRRRPDGRFALPAVDVAVA